MVFRLVPLMAAAKSSESMVLAVPGSPTSISPRLPARVMMHRSTRASLPRYFFLTVICFPFHTSGSRLPRIKVRTALGDSLQPRGLGPASKAARAASSSL